VLAVLAGAASVAAADLTAEALAGWQRYVQVIEQRRAAEPPKDGRFLALDYLGLEGTSRSAIVSGQRPTERPPAARVDGRPVEVRSGLVHHWIGAVFVPGVSLDRLLARLEASPPPQADVLKSAVLGRNGAAMKVYLRLRRTKLVTVVYDTEHDVRFLRLDAKRASSTSVATKIVQLDGAGTASERALPAGQDDGYLWRLNAYWRYEEVPGGVIAECESLTLSRSVPFGLRTIVSPLISSAARESMAAALGAVQALGHP
jgi:hypothetical protein